MSNYSPTLSKSFDVEGDEVKVTMKRLTRGEFGLITPFMPEDPTKGIPPSRALELLEVFAKFLPDKIVSFEGLKDKDDVPINFETALGESYFFVLMMEIVSTMVEGSTLQEKKSIDSSP